MQEPLFNISEIEIRYNPKIPALQRACITSPEEAYHQFILLFDMNLINIKEEAVVLYSNRRNRVVGAYKISSGGITGTVVDIRLILGIALKCLATGIISAIPTHQGILNHPGMMKN
jgi:DNA repair protein RadC